MKCFFVDTNLFLQCRPLKELPWKEISEGEDVVLVVPRTTQVEIDNFKSDGKGRRSQRARATSTTFREIIRSPNLEMVVRAVNPRVTMTLAAPLGSARSQGEADLDPSRPDNAILHQLLTYRATRQANEHVAVLTQDINLLLSARMAGVAFIEVPDEWLMPPEQDERDKKIKALEEELRLLASNAPVIEIAGGHVGALDQAEPPTISVPRFMPFTDKELSHLLYIVGLAFPMQPKLGTDTESGRYAMPNLAHLARLNFGLVPPSVVDIARFQEEEYPAWLAQMKRDLLELPQRLNEEAASLAHEFTILNTGSVPAEHVVVRIEASHGFEIGDPSKNADQSPVHRARRFLPAPPARPVGRRFGAYARALNNLAAGNDLLEQALGPISLSSRRDRNSFYRKTPRAAESSTVKEFECEEFRHQVSGETFSVIVTPSDPGMPPAGGILSCEVTARNLRRPARVHAAIRVSSFEASAVDEAQKMILLLCKSAEGHAPP